LRNENLKKKLEINFTTKFCGVHPEKTRDIFSPVLGSVEEKSREK
jgi:hypothetical protein